MDTVTPRVITTIMQANRKAQVTSLPDSGLTVEALSSVLAARHKLVVSLVAPGVYDIRHASDRSIEILSTTRIEIFLNNSTG